MELRAIGLTLAFVVACGATAAPVRGPEPAAAARPEPVAELSPPLEATLEERMNEVVAAYDKQDHARAEELARAVLADSPKALRMLRILVSIACIQGDAAKAKTAFAEIPAEPALHREQMRRRCARYGIAL